MESMIHLSECKDENILKNFEKLRSNIPVYLKDEAECNPFIQYIESVGRISEDLLEFLYHSDFLSLITEQTIPAVKTLYIRDAEIEWFYLIQKIFEEFADKADEYVTVIMECFEWQEDIAIVEGLLEASGMSDIDVFRKKVEEYRKKVNENMQNPCELPEKRADDNIAECERNLGEASCDFLQETKEEQFCAQKNDFKEFERRYIVLKEEKEQLSAQYKEVFSTLQRTYEIIRSNKEQEQLAKLEIESMKKSHALKDRFIALERERNAELIDRIQELEDANDSLLDEIFNLKRNLLAANEEIKHNRQELEEWQMGRVTEPEDNIDDTDGSFDVELEDKDELSDILADLEHEEDYSDVSFAYDETAEEESIDTQDEAVTEEIQQEAEPYEFTDVMEAISDKEVIKRKCKWFLENLFGHSKKMFLKKSREEQERLIFMKMMELHFPMDYQRNVRAALTNLGDTISCFDLYKMICSNPSSDELMSFLSEFQACAADE